MYRSISSGSSHRFELRADGSERVAIITERDGHPRNEHRPFIIVLDPGVGQLKPACDLCEYVDLCFKVGKLLFDGRTRYRQVANAVDQSSSREMDTRTIGRWAAGPPRRPAVSVVCF